MIHSLIGRGAFLIHHVTDRSQTRVIVATAGLKKMSDKSSRACDHLVAYCHYWVDRQGRKMGH